VTYTGVVNPKPTIGKPCKKPFLCQLHGFPMVAFGFTKPVYRIP